MRGLLAEGRLDNFDQAGAPVIAAAADGEDSTRPDPAAKPRGVSLWLPWILLAVWLLGIAGVLAYWASESWGWFGDLPLIVGCAGNYVGLTGWLLCWAMLAQLPRWQRLAYLVVGLLGGGLLLGPLLDWELEFGLYVASVAAGVAVPLGLLRWRGYRLGLTAGGPLWQFSISDLLIATTIAAVGLGLVLAMPEDWRGPVVASLGFSAGIVVVVIVGLGVPRLWIALVACPLLAAAIGALAIAGVVTSAQQIMNDALPVTLLLGLPALIPGLIAIGMLRCCGWRLRRD